MLRVQVAINRRDALTLLPPYGWVLRVVDVSIMP
jgi:hypothetical protein